MADWLEINPNSSECIKNKPFGQCIEQKIKTFETKYNQNVAYIPTNWNPVQDRIDQISYCGHTYDVILEDITETTMHYTYTPHEGGVGQIFI
jgi:hypothetical protein